MKWAYKQFQCTMQWCCCFSSRGIEHTISKLSVILISIESHETLTWSHHIQHFQEATVDMFRHVLKLVPNACRFDSIESLDRISLPKLQRTNKTNNNAVIVQIQVNRTTNRYEKCKLLSLPLICSVAGALVFRHSHNSKLLSLILNDHITIHFLMHKLFGGHSTYKAPWCCFLTKINTWKWIFFLWIKTILFTESVDSFVW